MKIPHLYFTTVIGSLLVSTTHLGAEGIPDIGADQLGFSVLNMDTSADPADDFLQFAAGGWIDRVDRPADKVSVGALAYQQDLILAQIKVAVMKAAEASDDAPVGSPVQQVGAFYKAFMDTDARDAAGVEPLRGEFDRIDSIGSFADLSRYLGEQERRTGEPPLLFVAPNPDFVDNTVYKTYSGNGNFAMKDASVAIYLAEPGSELQVAYVDYVHGMLSAAGYEADVAEAIAAKIVALETELYSGKLTPAESRDFSNFYNPMSFVEFQAEIPQLDIKLFLEGAGLEIPQEIVNSQKRYLPKLSAALDKYTLDDIKDYLTYLVIKRYSSVLSTSFEEPAKQLTATFTGVAKLAPPEERLIELLRHNLGQPLSQVYVDEFFTAEARQATNDMIARVKATFLARIPSREWLSDSARAEALKKAEAIKYTVGYPDEWVDYSKIEIGSDLVQNMLNLSEFAITRDFEKASGPVLRDSMNNPGHTLPIDLNAAYSAQQNGFEVSAAMIAAPVFMPEMDAAVNFCRLGAVVGHEMTHGFDSGGKAFDSRGNLRNWWSDDDTAAFAAEAQKLIDQGNATEILPGLYANGAANVGENMADTGGITFAHEALLSYLAEHPEENVEIDGLTPSQRCFISWAQLWTEKVSEPVLKSFVLTNEHPPNIYRTIAPLQHLDAFYQAFDIKEGDPMWLPPEQRVNAW